MNQSELDNESIEEFPELDTDIVTEEVDRYPTKNDMKVATRTLICKIGTYINIKKVYDTVKETPGKIEKIKAGNKKDLDNKVIEEKATRKNKKTKKTFYNQVTLIIKPYPERTNGINMKLSENGSIQMTGPKTIEEGHKTIEKMLEYLYEFDKEIFYNKIKTISTDETSVGTDSTMDTNITDEVEEPDVIKYFTEEELKKIPILSTQCELIIVSFQVPLLIHLSRFNAILKDKYNLLSIFGTSSYPGINTKFTYDYDCKEQEHVKKKKRYLCKCRDMSIFTFRTGKVIITGFENIEKIQTIFEKYIEIVKMEEANIKIEPNKLETEKNKSDKPNLMEVNGKVFEIIQDF